MVLRPGIDIVLVTGPPGSGKTTMARALADAAELSVHVESDWFFRFLRSGRIPPHLPEARAQNDIVMDLTVDSVIAYTHGGYLVYWDGIVGPWYLDRVAARVPEPMQLHYVVLRPRRGVALAKVAHRDGSVERSGAETMYGHFEELGRFEGHCIDTDDAIEPLVRMLEDGLRESRFVLRGRS